MIVHYIVLAFVAAFVALAVFGHVLLLGDLWQAIAPKRTDDDGGTRNARYIADCVAPDLASVVRRLGTASPLTPGSASPAPAVSSRPPAASAL